MCIRVPLLSASSGDLVSYLIPWLEAMRAGGGLASLAQEITNYTTPYTLFLTLISYLPGTGALAIKLLSCAFDGLLAVSAGRVVFQLTQCRERALLAAGLTAMLPTVFLNSAAWGQCDSIYVSFLILFLLHGLKGNGERAMLYFSIAFSFKLQAIFALPLLVWFLLKRQMRLRHLLWIPTVYIIELIPPLLAGRGFFDLLSIYLGQLESYAEWTLNFSNLYTLIPSDANLHALPTALSVMAAGLIGVLLWRCWQVQDEVCGETVLVFTLLAAMLMAFFLPHMHERYGYFVDILMLVYAVIQPRHFWYAAIWAFVSLTGYFRYFLGIYYNWAWSTLAYALCLILMTQVFLKLTEPRAPESTEHQPIDNRGDIMTNTEQSPYLEAGKIINTHGIRGEVRVQPWCDDPEFLRQFDALLVDGRAMNVSSTRMHKGNVLVKFEGIDTIEQAEALKNKLILIDRQDVELPEGRHFIADLIGLTVRNADTGEEIGKLVDVLEYPTQDIYQVKGAHEYLIPAVDAFKREVNLDEGWMSLVILEGMATDAD